MLMLRQVVDLAAREIIQHAYRIAACEQQFNGVRTNEAGSPGYQNTLIIVVHDPVPLPLMADFARDEEALSALSI
jgi:hypothetical protein